MRGWDLSRVREYCQSKGWRLAEVLPMAQRRIRFQARVLISTAPYESIEFISDEEITCDDREADSHRRKLIQTVKRTIDDEALEVRRELKATRLRQARR
jgi:hypothetical protein